MLFYAIDSSELYVYHYTSCSTLLEKILPSFQLRLSTFSKTNDPREYKEWTFAFGARNNFGKDLQLDEIEKRASELLKGTCRLLCTTADAPDSAGVSIDNIYGRGFCRPRMWAQYAENHRGACLVFDRAQLDRGIREAFISRSILSGAVAYVNRPRAPDLRAPNAFILDADAIRVWGLEKATDIHFSSFYKGLFFEKAKDWSDEREYRWLVRGRDNEDLFVNVKEVMKGVMVGDACTIEQRNKIHELVAGKNIPVGIMNWKSGIPEVLLSSPWLRWGCRGE